MGLDFVETYQAWVESVPSPAIFKLWAGISALAGALERRVWAKVYARPTYANLFITLVATPGVGKGVIEESAHLWRKTKLKDGRKGPALHVAPDSSTTASLLLSLKDAHRVIIKDGQLLDEYHSLLVAAEEMAVLLPGYDTEFLGRLNYLFTNPPDIRVRRVYTGEEIAIVNPHVNILAGAQPGYLASTLPEIAWSMGFTARLIMVYAAQGPRTRLFQEDAERAQLEAQLLTMLGEVCELYGAMQWEPRVQELLVNWDASGQLPLPDHVRLVHYNQRRLQFLIKLMTIAAISRARELVIREVDYHRGLTWLVGAEEKMPDVFREMVHKSDTQVLQELHFYLWKEWLRLKKPIMEERVWNFLSLRIPADKVQRVLDVAVRAGILDHDPTLRTYKPKPQGSFSELE